MVLCVSCDKASEDTDEDQVSSASHVQFHPQTVAGVPAKGIAKLMAPKPALCGHDVEVTYDSLVFLG